MKETGFVKKIDELGRIVVPKDIRNKLGVKALDSVELFIEGDRVILKKHGDQCAFCGETEELISFKNKYVCRACLDELNK